VTTPVPDPTLMTTAQLYREVQHIRELYDTRLEQLDLRLEQRFQAQSKALDAALLAADLKSDALSDKIDTSAAETKTLVGTQRGMQTQRTESRLNTGQVVLLVGLAMSVAFSVLTLVLHH
jgi:hypothetical protein